MSNLRNLLLAPTAVRVALFVVVACAAGGAAAAPSIALLPAAGSAPKEQRTKLDAALRKALINDGGYVVQAGKDTGEQIAFMAEQGTICVSSDIPCLQKLGILCDVQLLLIPEASGERELEVTITLLNAEDANVVRTVKGTVNLATDAAKKLTDRALHGSINGGDDPDEPPPVKRDPLAKDPITGPVDGQPVDETQLNDMQFAGVATAGVGGGLGALALLGALGCEAIFWTGTGTADTRKNVIAPMGAVLWIATVVGAATAGAGGAVYLAGSPDTEDKGLSAVP